MRICPKCNGLSYETYICQGCYSIMQDHGRMVDYYDKYSPYLDENITNKVDGLTAQENEKECLHLFYCGQCEKEQYVSVSLV